MCDHEASLPIVTEPVTTAATTTTNAARRGFMRMLVGGTLALLTFPTRWSHAKKYGVKRATLKNLETVGGSAQVKIKDKDVLLIRDTANSIRAINPVCTHKKCMVRYQSATNDIGCKCHKSKFLLDGTVVSGPAPRPLTTYSASLSADQIVISLPD
jgi:Rieske Fe-S protein